MSEEQIKKEFEVWYRNRYCLRLSDKTASIALRTNSKGEYDSYHLREAWEIWQAAFASHSKEIERILLENKELHLGLAKIKADESLASQAKSVQEDVDNLQFLFNEVNTLCQLICNSPPDTPIKGEIESRAFLLGHFPQVLNANRILSVPDGYVLVPNEPTDEMVEAAARHYESGDYTGIRSTYKVMLAASPQHPIDDRVWELEAKYSELIMAVARKYPNETRHQTALRYINNAEVAAEQAMKGANYDYS